LIAEDERRCQHVCGLTSALSARDVHKYLVATGATERRPRGDRKASP
jgi:hypothetical protein